MSANYFVVQIEVIWILYMNELLSVQKTTFLLALIVKRDVNQSMTIIKWLFQTDIVVSPTELFITL